MTAFLSRNTKDQIVKVRTHGFNFDKFKVIENKGM